jgi:hypothetical protein
MSKDKIIGTVSSYTKMKIMLIKSQITLFGSSGFQTKNKERIAFRIYIR